MTSHILREVDRDLKHDNPPRRRALLRRLASRRGRYSVVLILSCHDTVGRVACSSMFDFDTAARVLAAPARYVICLSAAKEPCRWVMLDKCSTLTEVKAFVSEVVLHAKLPAEEGLEVVLRGFLESERDRISEAVCRLIPIAPDRVIEVAVGGRVIARSPSATHDEAHP